MKTITLVLLAVSVYLICCAKSHVKPTGQKEINVQQPKTQAKKERYPWETKAYGTFWDAYQKARNKGC